MGRWGVCLACCFLNFVHLGVGRMSGLLYLAAARRYGASRSEAAAPFFLCYTVRNVSGPLIGYIGRKVELRLLIVSGCVLAAFGAGACFLAQDITTVTVLWGGVFGLGFGMATMLIPQVLNQHFDRYTTIANGISFGGECIAGFVLPFLIKFLQNTYGTSGLFLILSSLILHSVPAAMLLKPPERTNTKKKESRNKETENGNRVASNFSDNRDTTENPKSFLGSGSKSHQVCESHNGEWSNCDNPFANSLNSCNLSQNRKVESANCSEQDCSGKVILHNTSLPSSEYELDTNKSNSCHHQYNPSDKMTVHQKSDSHNASLLPVECKMDTNKIDVYHHQNVPDKTIFHRSKDCQHGNAYYNSASFPSKESKLSANSNHHHCDSDKTVFHQKTDYQQGDPKALYVSDNSTVDFRATDSSKPHKPFLESLRIFINPSFIIILITQSSVIYIGTMVVTIVVDYCQDNGLTEGDQVYVLMSFSTADMLGRFGLGWIADGGHMSKNNFFALSHLCMGLSLAVLMFLKSFAVILVAVFFAGLSLGGLLIVGPGIISDFIEEDLVTMALASRFVLYAPMSLTQFPLIGFFRGIHGSYDWILCILTFICLVCAILTLLLPCSKRFQFKTVNTTEELS